MIAILIEKEKAKKKLEEFVIAGYWTKSKPIQFKDITEKFCHLSDGTIVNYLDELITEKKIRKWRNENRTYYAPPKMHLAVKLCIIVTIICLPATFLSFIWQPFFYLLFFNVGVLFTCFFWRFSNGKKQKF